MEDSSEYGPFRDAMRDVAADALGLRDNYLGEQSDVVVDAILGMPEMQAIRAALDVALECSPLGCPYLLQDGSEGSYGPNTCNQGCQEEPECITHSYPRLPASVVQWVRS